MPDITIREARVKVVDAERQMLQILQQLESDTGLKVQGLETNVAHRIDGQLLVVVRIKTEL